MGREKEERERGYWGEDFMLLKFIADHVFQVLCGFKETPRKLLICAAVCVKVLVGLCWM